MAFAQESSFIIHSTPCLLITKSHQPPQPFEFMEVTLEIVVYSKLSRFSTSSFGWLLPFSSQASVQLFPFKATVIIFMVSQQKNSPVQISLIVYPVILNLLGMIMIDIRIPQRRTPTLENLTSPGSELFPYILSHHSWTLSHPTWRTLPRKYGSRRVSF